MKSENGNVGSRLASLAMSHVCRLGFACLIVILTGCDPSSKPFNWPSFDDEVMEVGRRVLQAQPDERSAEEAVRDEPTSATREAVLKNLKLWVDVGGMRGERAVKAIQELGPNAVDPLLEILADVSLPRRYADRAVSLLIPLGQERRDTPDGARSTGLSSLANNIFDAVVDYVRRHPEAQPNLAGLGKITRVERIPRVIELVESSSGQRQSSYIGLFSAVTYTSCPTIPWGFCGNSSPASIDKLIKDGQERQQESVSAIKAWWAEHKNESPEVWLTASLLRSIRKRTEYLKAEVFTDADEWQKNNAIRQYYPPHAGIWRPSVFGMLVEEFDKSPGHVRPYVLRMIGSTEHPDAAAFIAPELGSTDPNLQHAAVAALKDLRVSDHNQTIGRILRSTKDQGLALEAIDALKELAGAGALEDFTYALDHPEHPVSDRAKEALKPYLVSHADRLRELVRSHPSKKVRRSLGVILDGASAAGKTSTEERVAATRALLRSDDSERHKLGIRLAARYPELLPDVLELIRSTDSLVRYSAVELIQKTGIPGLTVENAPRLMGYSSELDRHIAAYCYAKYGRKAVPVMKKAAFSLSDPFHPTNAPGHPAVGLIRALVQEKVPGIERDVIRLVKDSRSNSRYVDLLQLLDGSKSASLLGEFLRHDERHYRLAAIRVVRARHLTQHADRMFELASLTFDQNEIDRLHVQFDKGKLTSQELNQRTRPIHDRPYDQHEATLALIDLGDPRAWQAVLTCLDGEYLEWRKRSGVLAGPRTVTAFGVAVSKVRTKHRDDIQVLMREELQGENRERVVVCLTTALCMDPEAADSEVLWGIATAPHADEGARILAGVALSKLGERRVIPLLHKLIRSFIAPDPERRIRGHIQPGLSSVLTKSQQWHLRQRRPSLLDFDLPRPLYQPMLELHHIDLGLALRRLGDESLVDELVAALADARGDFNTTAYQMLIGVIELRAYQHAREWFQTQDLDNPQFLSVLASLLLAYDVPPEDVLALIVVDDFQLRYNTHYFISAQITQATDAIIDAYDRLPKRSGDHTPIQMIQDLCEFGDLRGIALAAKDPLLLASVVRYLPDAPGVDFPAGHFDYNRIEEAMRVHAWYEQHAGDLRWDSESSQFRLASHAP